MNALTRPPVLAALVALATHPAVAQQNPALPVAGVQQVGLLIHPGVQNELKLDDKQVEAAKALAGRTRETMQANAQAIQGLDPADRNRKLEEMNRGLEAQTVESIASILNEAQRKRLRQISLQQRGGMAFVDPEVQKDLKMSEAQKARVQSLVNESFLQMRSALQNAQANRQEAIEKAQSLRKRLTETLTAELTDEQKATWKAMLGAPFEVRYESGK
jgi:hypothetical protein